MTRDYAAFALVVGMLMISTGARSQAPPASAASAGSGALPAAEASASASTVPVGPSPIAPTGSGETPTAPEPLPIADGGALDASVDASGARDASDDASGAWDAPLEAEQETTVALGPDAGAAPAASVSASAPPPALAVPVSPSPPPRPTSVGDEKPMWNILPILSEPEADGAGDLAEQILPSLGLGERGNLLGYFVVLLLAAFAGHLAGKARRKLPVRGMLPRVMATLHVGMRALVVVLGLALLAKWIPASYAPVFLWVALAAAAAAGWSARDFLPDVFAGLVLLIERRVRPGTWVTNPSFAGEIETIGPRATRLRDGEGRILSVPNRKLLAGPVAIDVSRRPRIEVVIRVPESIGPARARQAIEDAALVSPWRLLESRPEVRREADDPRAWRVQVRLIEPRFARAFESALIDHAEENLRGDGTEAVQVKLAQGR